MLIDVSNLTLADLRQNFGLLRNTTDLYFQSWLNHLPTLTSAEVLALDRLAANYEYLSESDSPLEEVIKLVVLSPLLDLAGFYRSPFLPKTEISTSLEIADDPDASPIQGKIDVLILQESFWVLVIESKPARIDVTAGIPQLLTYLLSAPSDHIPFGMIINGREVLFLKLDRSTPQPQYLKSMAYRLLDSPQERSQILQALKYIGQQISGNNPAV